MPGSNFPLLIILAVSIVVRIGHFDYPLSDVFWWGDGTRDYLVANHILKYQEYPRGGPFNLLFDEGYKNSPFYFYVLALFLIPFNHPLTLSFVNIVLQVLSLILIYLITTRMFGKAGGLWATAIYSFNPLIIKLSEYIWQPYLMQPVNLVSLFLLLQATFKQSLKLLAASYSLLFLAFLLHSSAIPSLPVFFIATAVFFRKKIIKLLSASGFVVLIVAVLVLVSKLPEYLAVKNISSFTANFSYNINQILQAFYVNYIFLIGVLVATIYILFSRKKLADKRYLIFSFFLFISPLLFASFFHKIRIHYLIISTTFFVIWIVFMVEAILGKKGALILFLILAIFSNGFSFLMFDKKPLDNFHYIENVSDKIILDLKQIKQDKNYQNFNFFRVKTLGLKDKVYDYPILDTLILVPLEAKLNQKLTEITDDNAFNHKQINKEDYLLLSCIYFKGGLEKLKCLDEFEKRYPAFKLERKIYFDKNLEIYLFEKISAYIP